VESLFTEEKVYPSPVVWNDLVVLTSGGSPPGYMIALRNKNHKNKLIPEQLWEKNRMIPRISSPIVYNDLIYTVTDGGIATARDIKTGQVIWKNRLFPSDYYASITAADGLLFFSSTTGETIVTTAEKEPKTISLNSLPEPIISSMAISKGEIFIRGEKHLYCISTEKNDS